MEKCKEVIVMRELFVEKVIDTTGEFLDNNQRIKLKEILTEICLNYHIEILEQSQKQERQKTKEFHILQELQPQMKLTMLGNQESLLQKFIRFLQWAGLNILRIY